MSEVGVSAMDTMPGTFAVGFGLTPEPVHAAALFTAMIADGPGLVRIDSVGIRAPLPRQPTRTTSPREPVHTPAPFTVMIADGPGSGRIHQGGAATAGLRGGASRRARPGKVAPLAVLAGRYAGPAPGGSVGAT